MNCPKCGASNPNGVAFCASCGAPLPADIPLLRARWRFKINFTLAMILKF